MSMVIEYQDLERLLADLYAMPDQIDEGMDRDLAAAAQDCVRMGQELAHVKKGFMKQTIHALRVGYLHYQVFSDAHYTVYEVNRPGIKEGTSHDWMTPPTEMVTDKYPTIMVDTAIKRFQKRGP